MKTRTAEVEWQSSRLKITKAELEAHQAVNLAVGGLLGGVSDQASWDAARSAAVHMYERYGYEMPEVPEAYDPAAVQALRRQSLDVKDAIVADLADEKFRWQREDDRIDNARADRSDARTDRYRARSDNRAERADRRSAVRFKERALDRAAFAGVRTDTDDLDREYH